MVAYKKKDLPLRCAHYKVLCFLANIVVTMRVLTTIIVWSGLLCLYYPVVSAESASPDERCKATMGDGRMVRCVDLRLCNSAMAAIRRDRRSMSPETQRLLQDAHCGFADDGSPLICCSDDGQLLVDTPMKSKIGQWLQKEQLNAPVGTIVRQDHPKLSLLPLENCGSTLFERIGRPLNVLIESDATPTVVRLLYTSFQEGKEQFLCGGSLISSRYVLTSAHCITNLPPSKTLSSVIVGDFDISTNPDCRSHSDIRLPNRVPTCKSKARRLGIERIFMYPNSYRDGMQQPDLALIRLDRSVNFTEWDLIPTCLPLGAFQFLELRGRDKGSLVTMGWGTDLRGNVASSKMRMGSLRAVDGERCRSLVRNGATDVVQIACVEGHTPMDDKIADFGGPLSVVEAWIDENVPRMIQVALLSKRVVGQPAIYTRIGPYLSWILNTIQP